MQNNHILFVVSKSTGFTALKSFLEININSAVSILALDDRKDQRTCFKEIIEISKKYNIQPLVAKNKNCLNDVISKYKPDLVFVCGWYWIIPDKLLAQVPLGFLGIHNSLLPKYRGHAPLVWSMLNGDEYIGSSLFKFETGMDTGDIFYQWRIHSTNMYMIEVLRQLEIQIQVNFGSLLLDVLHGKAKATPQNGELATYSSKRREEDGYIDWTTSVNDIILKIKALSSPYPNAFTFINDKKISLQKAEVFEYPTFGEYGQVAFTTCDYAVICCSKGQAIKVTEASDIAGEKNILKLFPKLSSPPKFFE